jgi:threonine dehydratase
MSIGFDDVLAAHARIEKYIHRTPVLTSSRINEATGGTLFFKCENFQRVGAFKARGAHNALFSLPAANLSRGVITHSSGNHAAAVSLAAQRRNVQATIVMPENAPRIKKQAVAGYGATIVECAPTIEAREATVAAIVSRTGATLIHPYDDDAVIAGQGTVCLELLRELNDLETLLVPVGGGGLLSGCAIAAKSMQPWLRVVGVEPEASGDAYASFHSGQRVVVQKARTIADGLRVPLGVRNFDIIRQRVDDIVTVTDDAIIAAMRLIWEAMKIVVEPSASLPVAALLEGKIRTDKRPVGIVLSGGNVDLDALPWVHHVNKEALAK